MKAHWSSKPSSFTSIPLQILAVVGTSGTSQVRADEEAMLALVTGLRIQSSIYKAKRRLAGLREARGQRQRCQLTIWLVTNQTLSWV